MNKITPDVIILFDPYQLKSPVKMYLWVEKQWESKIDAGSSH